MRQKVIFAFTCVPFLMFMPLLWRISFRSSFELVPGLLTASYIWWIGSLGCAVVLFAYNLFRRPNLTSAKPGLDATADLGRRAFLQKSVGVAAAAPFMLSGYGVLLERRHFEVEEFDISVSGLSAPLSNLRIVQLSDIHVGPFMTLDELLEYVETVNRLKPDVIALTGDFVTSSRQEVLPCLEALKKLQARYGIFACLGNHDMYAGVGRELTQRFHANGIRMLRNEAITLEVGSSKLGMLGIDDLGRGRPDLSRAVAAAQLDPAEVNILLSHRPEIFPRAAREGIDLVLSGHYHGGQVKLLPDPHAVSIARFMTPYAEGLFRLPFKNSNAREKKNTNLFVSRGIGVTALPLRINCPPQIAHLTLKKA
jgi:predicted MPP superfamily phosphohydrolase